jgi:hypothetical protein
MILTPIPGSRDFEAYQRGEGTLLSREWALYDGHHAVHVPRQMTPYELQTETMKAMRGFYSPGKVLRTLGRGDWFEAAVACVGFGLTRMWTRIDRHYVAKLRADLERGARDLAGNLARTKRPRSVVVALNEATLPLQGAFETFFRELGVKVVQSGHALGEAVSSRYDSLAREGERAGKRMTELLTTLRGEADCVIRPVLKQVASESQRLKSGVEDRWQELRNAASEKVPVIDFHLDLDPRVLRQRLTELALVFTDDFRAIRRAYERSIAIVPGMA